MKPTFDLRAARCFRKRPRHRNLSGFQAVVFCTVSLLIQSGAPAADSDRSPGAAGFAARATRQYVEARALFLADTNNADAAWQFARACFDLAEYAATDRDRERLADIAIPVARQLVSREPKRVQGHYYLAMNYGQLARTKTFGALRLVDQMEDEFKISRTLDEHFDYAGPDRNLGLLYLEAPTFGSIGSRSKARQHLRRAVELAPGYPENRLNLAEAYLKWGDRADAVRELKAIEELWPVAHTQFAGEDWEATWVDWEKRLKTLQSKIGQPSKPIKSPRSQ